MSEKKCLVTTSLIGAVDWAKNAPGSVIKEDKGGDGIQTWAGKAIRDLKETIGRTSKWEPNIAATRGINFENKVYHCAKTGDLSTGSDYFKKVVEEIIGGEFQRKGKQERTVDGEQCFLYGKEDCYFPNKIIDIKTTANFKVEKYTDSIQHIMYCIMEDVWKFVYIVAEWGTYPEIKKLHRVEINPQKELAYKILDAKIIETFDYLKKNNLWELYRNEYCLY